MLHATPIIITVIILLQNVAVIDAESSFTVLAETHKPSPEKMSSAWRCVAEKSGYIVKH